MSSETEIRPFRVDMPEEAITDLRQRIAAMRWPSKELVADRSQGVQLATLQELARYWAADYDWRACEETLNALPIFKTEIDAVDIHFIQGLGGPVVLGKRASPGPHGRAATTPGQAPGRLHHIPGRDLPGPRSWVEASYPTLTYFNEADRGGHFAAWEEPDVFTTEVRAAFKPLR